jgi:3-oxoacyl-[acyl-carrier protein] reductase/2-deoxy-D-gluconate 3-dehydrogenase
VSDLAGGAEGEVVVGPAEGDVVAATVAGLERAPRTWHLGPVAGAAGAVLGAVLLAGVTLLLHPGPGALATAGFLVALPLGALAAAFWAGVPESGAVRGGRRWGVAVVAFLLAGPFAEAWIRQAPLREAGWGRALAVLLLLALPAYGVGMVLGWLQHRKRGTAVAALAGGALGALAAAVWLIPKFDPGILFAGGAIILIAASWMEGVFGGGGGMLDKGEKGAMEDKVVVITGAGVRGQLGYALAETFLAQGASVVMTARSPEVEGVARTLGEGAAAVGVAADLTRAEEAERVVATALREFGRLDILVNVAGGLTVFKRLAETTSEEWAREVERNAHTAFLMSRAALPALRESRGTIINFASPAGLRARAGIGAYSAGKAAVVALTRALALEERAHGVRVNAIAPGLIDTEQNRAAVPDPEQAAWVTRTQVAEVVLFLAGERGAGVNGETIEVLGAGLE